jgi:phosphatidylglycerophosphate synthase
MKPDHGEIHDGPDVLRRPIQARNTKWAAKVARWLASVGLRPNHISVLSMVFGGLAAGCFLVGGHTESVSARIILLIAAAVCIQFRLLCNLFDGMVAIEGGFKTKSGEVFNELPDRFSDIAILLSAGYSLPGVPWTQELGWSAALLSVLTAYVRAFGGAAGASQYFCGPMAKQQRMAVMTTACLLNAAFVGLRSSFQVLPWALAIIVMGCVVTIVRRTFLIIRELESK